MYEASKSFEGLSEDSLLPLNDAISSVLAAENVQTEDIGLLHEAADELERAANQLNLQKRIDNALASISQDLPLPPKELQALSDLYHEGSDFGMKAYKGMVDIQRELQHQVSPLLLLLPLVSVSIQCLYIQCIYDVFHMIVMSTQRL